MPGGYTADEQSAAKLAGAIADSPTKLIAGTVTKTTSATTAVVAHGLGSTPDFILCSGNKVAASALAYAADGTSITFTRDTATGTWTVSYIAGYTA